MQPMELVLYIHGKGGSAAEAEHYAPLFPGGRCRGLDYRTFTPWETGEEIRRAVTAAKSEYDRITLIANSMGAFFALHAGIDHEIDRAYFISPIVDMEQLIGSMMARAGVTEEELRRRGVVRTDFGEDLSWDYLAWVRDHPVRWAVPTRILYGRGDALTPYETVAAFAERHGAELTVMENGEHWFHTPGQMAFLDAWIKRG